jgi:hypothetical protein
MGTGMHRNLGDKGHFLGERRAIFLDQARSCIWDHRHAEYRHHQSTLLYTINNTQLHTIYVTRVQGAFEETTFITDPPFRFDFFVHYQALNLVTVG